MFAWIILGLIAGWLASILTGNDKRYGCCGSAVLGMIGSIVGGFLASWFYTGQFVYTNAFTDLNIRSLVVSTIGAVVVLVIASILRK
jgi:uncharacterized membrane protein YeaQ/YmgE (transglycosylase-associated protein family)